MEIEIAYGEIEIGNNESIFQLHNLDPGLILYTISNKEREKSSYQLGTNSCCVISRQVCSTAE